MKVKCWLILLAMVSVAGCTGYMNYGSPSKTSGGDYTDEGFFGGPSAKYLGDGVYMVTVSGLLASTQQSVYTTFHDYARKVAQDNGYAGYSVLDYDTSVNSLGGVDARGRIRCYK